MTVKSSDVPDIYLGNLMSLGELFNVSLVDGDILYVKCIGSSSDNIFVITD